MYAGSIHTEDCELYQCPNPKDLIGVTKVPSLSVIPSTALIELGRAMENGAKKYGHFNWREHPVKASIYVDAAIRHLMSWFDGEQNAEDSGVHHLGHAMACCGILLDAQFVGNLIDDRALPPPNVRPIAPWLLGQYAERADTATVGGDKSAKQLLDALQAREEEEEDLAALNRILVKDEPVKLDPAFEEEVE